MPDHYETLGVSRDASLEEIRKAYKDLAKVNHPDRGGNAEKFKAIQAAHEVLSDDGRRQMYNMTGSDTPQQGGMAAGGIPFHFMNGMGGIPFGMPGVQFDMGSVFGNMFGGDPRKRRGGKGPNKHHDVGLRLSDFYKGHDIKLKFNQARKCAPCSGSGAESSENCGTCGGFGARTVTRQIGPGMLAQTKVACDVCNGEGKRVLRSCKACQGKKFLEREKLLDIAVKPGMRENEQLTYAGECSDSPEFDAPGDVVLTLKRADQDGNYEWREDHLWIRKQVSYAEAILGFSFQLVDHPNGAQPMYSWRGGPLIHGAVLQFSGGGMPSKRGGFGNLFVQVMITPPPTVAWTAEQTAHLQAVFSVGDLPATSLPLVLSSSDSKLA